MSPLQAAPGMRVEPCSEQLHSQAPQIGWHNSPSEQLLYFRFLIIVAHGQTWHLPDLMVRELKHFASVKCPVLKQK